MNVVYVGIHIKKMSKKLRSVGDWLSYNLCFKDLGFPIISTMLIGVLNKESNPKPLNPYLKVDQQS